MKGAAVPVGACLCYFPDPAGGYAAGANEGKVRRGNRTFFLGPKIFF
jgi:hypothetical protein